MTKCNKCGYDYSGSGDSVHPCVTVNVQQRTWVGLTDEEFDDLRDNNFGVSPLISAVEAKLKEKNCD